MKILLTNIYSYKNKGDATIVSAALQGLQRKYPNSSITMSSDDLNDKNLYGDFEIVPSFTRIINRSWSSIDLLNNLIILFYSSILILIFKLEKISSRLKINISWLYPSFINHKIQTYKNCDVVFGIGGGYLLTATKIRLLDKIIGRPSIHLNCLEFFFAKAYGKPVILLHQSVGPFTHSNDIKTVVRYLTKVELVIARENISYNFLREQGIINVLLKPDLAFSFTKEGHNYLTIENTDEHTEKIGVTVRSYLSTEKQYLYETELSKFIKNYLKANQNSIFYFIPQVIYSERNDDDNVVSHRIFSSLSYEEKKRCICLMQDLNPVDLRATIGACNLFIGTRMHSNIFAISKLVKTIAISYEPKTNGIMQMLGLQQYCINMHELTAELLESRIAAIRSDNNYNYRLDAKLQEIRAAIWDFDDRLVL